MPGNVATGFGLIPFGETPFGTVNWGRELFSLAPESVMSEDAESADDNLLKFMKSIEPSFNFLLDKADKYPNLIDPDFIPIALLPNLASNYSIELEQYLSDKSQRGFVRNAYKWMAQKGAALGYKIRASLSGFGVVVEALYRATPPIQGLIDAGLVWEIPPGSGKWYTTAAPLIAFYDETMADIIPTDLYAFEVGETPPEGVVFHDVSGCSWCKTHRLRLLITAENLDLQPGVSLSDALTGIVNRLTDVKPAHVEISQIIFLIELRAEVKVRVTLETFGTVTGNEPVVV